MQQVHLRDAAFGAALFACLVVARWSAMLGVDGPGLVLYLCIRSGGESVWLSPWSDLLLQLGPPQGLQQNRQIEIRILVIEKEEFANH